MVIIPAMHLPQNCHECPLMDNEWLTCNAPGPIYNENTWPYKDFRHPHCPLVDLDQYILRRRKTNDPTY